MADNHITIDRNKATGNNMLATIEGLRDHIDRLRQHKEQLEQMTDAVSFGTIETQCGLPAGKGETFYNLVIGANGEVVADVSLNQLIDWVGPLT